MKTNEIKLLKTKENWKVIRKLRTDGKETKKKKERTIAST